MVCPLATSGCSIPYFVRVHSVGIYIVQDLSHLFYVAFNSDRKSSIVGHELLPSVSAIDQDFFGSLFWYNK